MLFIVIVNLLLLEVRGLSCVRVHSECLLLTFRLDSVYCRRCIPSGPGFGEDDLDVTAVSRIEGRQALLGCVWRSLRSILTQRGDHGSTGRSSKPRARKHPPPAGQPPPYVRM